MRGIDEELRLQIRDQLLRIKTDGMPVSRIAAQLEVNRATVYQLLGGETTPTAKVLCNACRNLDMFFQVDGHKIAASDFPEKSVRPPITELQLGLFEMTASTIDSELQLKIRKKSNTIELNVQISQTA